MAAEGGMVQRSESVRDAIEVTPQAAANMRARSGIAIEGEVRSWGPTRAKAA